MMNLLAKTALKLKMFEQEPKIQEKWCKSQQTDIERLFDMIEDLIEKATSSNSSPMAYQLLQQSKADFISEFLETSATYRKIM